MKLDNQKNSHRHAWHAYEDFCKLRESRDDEGLWHSLSHHLRHVVYRTGLGLPKPNYVRRSGNG